MRRAGCSPPRPLRSRGRLQPGSRWPSAARAGPPSTSQTSSRKRAELVVEALGADPPLEDRVRLDQPRVGQLLDQHPRVREGVQGVGVMADDQGRLSIFTRSLVVRAPAGRGTVPRAPPPRAPARWRIQSRPMSSRKLVRGMRLVSEAMRFSSGPPKRSPSRIGVKIDAHRRAARCRAPASRPSLPSTRSG